MQGNPCAAFNRRKDLTRRQAPWMVDVRSKEARRRRLRGHPLGRPRPYRSAKTEGPTYKAQGNVDSPR